MDQARVTTQPRNRRASVSESGPRPDLSVFRSFSARRPTISGDAALPDLTKLRAASSRNVLANGGGAMGGIGRSASCRGAGPFRRASIDNGMRPQWLQNITTAHEDEAEDESNLASVADFQDVFQEMKNIHPNLPMGALRQKTMARMKEIQAEKEAEEQRLIMEERRREEEERKNKLANMALNKWMSKVKNRPSLKSSNNNSDQDNDDTIPKSETNRPTFQRPSVNDDSSSSSSDDAKEISVFPQIIPTNYKPRRRSLIMMRRKSSDTGESSGDDHHDFLSENNHHDESVENMAPRRSVGDLAKSLKDIDFSSRSDDKSVLSNHSFLSDFGHEYKFDQSVHNGNNDDAGDLILKAFSEEETEESNNGNKSVEGNRSSSNGKEMQECYSVPLSGNNNIRHTRRPSYTSTPRRPSCTSADGLNNSLRSYLSEYTADSSGLLVGFKAQTTDLIVGFDRQTRRIESGTHFHSEETAPGGFAADFSAWGG